MCPKIRWDGYCSKFFENWTGPYYYERFHWIKCLIYLRIRASAGPTHLGSIATAPTRRPWLRAMQRCCYTRLHTDTAPWPISEEVCAVITHQYWRVRWRSSGCDDSLSPRSRVAATIDLVPFEWFRSAFLPQPSWRPWNAAFLPPLGFFAHEPFQKKFRGNS